METTCEKESNNVDDLAAELFSTVENYLLSKDIVPPTQEVHVNKHDDESETNVNALIKHEGLDAEVQDEPNSLKDIFTKETKQLKRSVSFPDDSDIVTGFLDPPDPWKNDKGWKTEDLIQAYKNGCEKHNTKPSGKLLQQLQCIDNVGERYEILSLKGEKLDIRQCESLEEIFRRVRFRCLDLEASNLDDETAVAFCDMVEYYQTACKLNISFNKNIGTRGWQGISKLVRKTPCLTVIDARNCDVNERVVPILGRSLRMGCYLTRLQLQNTNLSGRALLILVAALKMNETLEELFIGDNKFMPTDGVHLGNLLKYNHTLQLLDLRNNHLQDDGVSHVCDGLAEQTLGSGLLTLVLWNNQVTFNAMAAINKALAASESLDTVNLGHNPITNEGIHVLKDGLLKTRSLLKLGMSGTKITCEGAIALAEVIADSPRLTRLDLQENDIKTAGLMALSLALKVNESLTRLDIDRETKKESGVKDYAEQQRRLQRDIAAVLEKNRDLVHKRNKEKKQLEVNNTVPHNLDNSESAPSENSYIPSDDKIQRPKLLSVDGEIQQTILLPFPGHDTSPTPSLTNSLQGNDILSPQYCNDPKLTAKQLFSVNKWSSPTLASPVTDATYPIVVPNLFKLEDSIQLSIPLESTILHTNRVGNVKDIEMHDRAVNGNISELLTDDVPNHICKSLEKNPQNTETMQTDNTVNVVEVTQNVPNTESCNIGVIDSAGTLDIFGDEIVNDMGNVSLVDHNETVVTDTGSGEGCEPNLDINGAEEIYANVEGDVEPHRNCQHCNSQCDIDTNTNAMCTHCDIEQVQAGCEFEAIGGSDIGKVVKYENDEDFEAIEQYDIMPAQSANTSDLDTAGDISHSNIPVSVFGVTDRAYIEGGTSTSDADSHELNVDTEPDNDFYDCGTSITLIDHNYTSVKTNHNANIEISPLSYSSKSGQLSSDQNEICSNQEIIDVGRNDQWASADVVEVEQLSLQREIECDSLDIEKWNTVEKSELVQGASDMAVQSKISTSKPDFFTCMTPNGLKQELASLIDDEGNQMGNLTQ